MLMELAVAVSLAKACAPAVAPETLLSVAHAESRLNPYAIGVNGGPKLMEQPESREEAIATATQLVVVEGKSVDLGIGQINSANLDHLGMSISDAFDPCKNLAGAARILEEAYEPSRDQLGDGQAALGQALSRYNTGKPDKGFANGYVDRVKASADIVVPAIATTSAAVAPTAPAYAGPVSSPEAIDPAVPSWDVFASRRDRGWDVFSPTPTDPQAAVARISP